MPPLPTSHKERILKMNNIIRRLFAVLIMTVCVLLLSACGEGGSGNGTETEEKKEPVTLSAVFDAVSAAVPDADKLTDAQASYLSGFLKASPEDFAGYKIVTQSISTSIDEIGIFEAKSKDDIKKIEEMIDTFFSFRVSIWDPKYLPEEYPKLEDAERVTSGNYVMYVILSDDARAAAITAFENITK